eukprot:jgi/Mesvir1/15870/Mv03415-RA.1
MAAVSPTPPGDRPPWQKVLYLRQPYADNFTDASFLASLVLNAHVARCDYTTLVAASSVISQQLATVTVFACAYHFAAEGRVSDAQLLAHDLVIMGAGTLAKGWLERATTGGEGECPRRRDLKHDNSDTAASGNRIGGDNGGKRERSSGGSRSERGNADGASGSNSGGGRCRGGSTARDAVLGGGASSHATQGKVAAEEIQGGSLRGRMSSGHSSVHGHCSESRCEAPAHHQELARGKQRNSAKQPRRRHDKRSGGEKDSGCDKGGVQGDPSMSGGRAHRSDHQGTDARVSSDDDVVGSRRHSRGHRLSYMLGPFLKPSGHERDGGRDHPCGSRGSGHPRGDQHGSTGHSPPGSYRTRHGQGTSMAGQGTSMAGQGTSAGAQYEPRHGDSPRYLQRRRRGDASPMLSLLRSASLFVVAVYVLCPVLHQLTVAISDDTIVASAVMLLLAHLFFHDYSYADAVSLKLSGNLSLHAALVAVFLLASRLPSRTLVFALLLFALELFLLSPMICHLLRWRVGPRAHLAFSWVMVGAATAMLTRVGARPACAFLALTSFVTLACPWWLVRQQRHKMQISGPWDEARPVLVADTRSDPWGQ